MFDPHRPYQQNHGNRRFFVHFGTMRKIMRSLRIPPFDSFSTSFFRAHVPRDGPHFLEPPHHRSAVVVTTIGSHRVRHQESCILCSVSRQQWRVYDIGSNHSMCAFAQTERLLEFKHPKNSPLALVSHCNINAYNTYNLPSPHQVARPLLASALSSRLVESLCFWPCVTWMPLR